MESLLIDVSTEFSPLEKKILKQLYKRYGDDLLSPDSDFNQWDVAAWLIETLDIPYEMAYTLTKTYYWNHHKLFREVDKVRKEIPMSNLFFSHLSKLNSNFDNTYLNEKFGRSGYVGTININIDKDSGFIDERDVNYWDTYKGFTLYMPFNSWRIGDSMVGSEERDVRSIMVDVTFYPIDKKGKIVDSYISDDSYEDLDNDKFKVLSTYRIGKDKENKMKLMDFKVPYPRPLTVNNFNETIISIIEDIKEKIGKTTFKLPNGEKGINVDSQPD